MRLEFSGDFRVPGSFSVDRRVAAADEFRTRNRRAIYRQDIVRGSPEAGHPRGRVLRLTASRPDYDVRQHYRRGRSLDSIVRVFLHQTGFFVSDPVDTKADDHRLDCVIAHFVVCQNGTLLYTHDMHTVLNGTGARRDSIEIEFEGHYNRDDSNPLKGPRANAGQLQAGRNLLAWLNSSVSGLRNLSHIHPHQQFSPDSRPNCPGPDIWVNVGEWAAARFGLNSDFGRRSISSHIGNADYRIKLP